MSAVSGRHREALARALRVAAESRLAAHDTAGVAGALYAQWYTRLTSPKPTGWPLSTPLVVRLRQALSHAALGRGVVDLHAIARRETLVPGSGYWMAAGPAGPPSVCLSASPPAARSGPAARRVYWNVVQPHAPALLHDLAATLPDDVPWLVKVPLEPVGYLRPDAVVLYLDGTAWPRLVPLVTSLAASHRDHLHPDVPPLTTWHEAGVGSARDTGSPTESFGQALCRRVAEVLATAASDGRDPSALLLATLFPGDAPRRSTRALRTSRRARRPHG